MNDPIRFDGRALLCPSCGSAATHIDDVYVTGRPREDGPKVPVHVDYRGQVDKQPFPSADGRRHSFHLVGTCEQCPAQFAIEFRQHKGNTLVETLVSIWQPVDPPDAPMITDQLTP